MKILFISLLLWELIMSIETCEITDDLNKLEDCKDNHKWIDQIIRKPSESQEINNSKAGKKFVRVMALGI